MLSNDDALEAIKEADVLPRRFRVEGVPFFIVNGKLTLSGAQQPDTFVIHAPGHTPGHCMFFRESDQLCIAGDVLANLNFLTGKPGLREPPSFLSVDVTQNRRSIQTLIDLQPKVVCFGHGPPLRNPNLLKRFMQNDAEKTGR